MSRREWAWVVVAAGLCLTLLASRLLPYDVFLALVGVLIGAVISGAISWYIYQRSSLQFHLLVTVLARHMKRAGLLSHISLDERGLLKDFTEVEPATSDEPEEGMPPTLTRGP